MKTEIKNAANQAERVESNCMYNQLKETTTANMNTAHPKLMLSSADLWNIQRNVRLRTGRRFFI